MAPDIHDVPRLLRPLFFFFKKNFDEMLLARASSVTFYFAAFAA